MKNDLHMDPQLTEILVCPICKGPLIWNKEKKEFVCRSDMKAYPVVNDIPIMAPLEARDVSEEEIEELSK